MSKAVDRGLASRPADTAIESIGIDEKSFQKGHQYCTIITDSTNKRVLEVVAERTKDAAKKAITQSLAPAQIEQLKVVTGDMWEAYQNTVKECLPGATYVIDRFHLVKCLNVAIDQTRRQEVKQNPVLKNARFALLKNQENLSEKQRSKFNIIAQENYLVSHVWKAKENFKALFGQPDFAHATTILSNWFNSLKDFTIKPLKAVKEMFQRHSRAIANSLCHKDSNAFAERMNGGIQELKTIAKGFKKIENFRTAILFHYGKLNLFPPLNFQ
jgi:transposase